MDSRTYGYEECLDRANWDLTKGSLVKVCITNFGSPPTYCMGIVIETAIKNKQTLFPSVMVYNLETKKITREFLGGLRIISKVD